ncbi:MAG: response regulator [Gammaproteobacteria bacterium]|nr:response regulator [Gammaproteobacteria bacterium]
MKALIVDDDSFIRQVLRMILSELSIEVVHESFSVKDADISIKSHQADVVFLDIMLPDGSGLDLIEPARKALPNAKILMISGNATQEKVKEAVDKGASGFIVKPFNANVVVKNIANALKIDLPPEYS